MADETLKNVDDVRYEREQLEFRVDAFLRTRGWKHSSSNPAHIWLWEKTLADGQGHRASIRADDLRRGGVSHGRVAEVEG
jgi:hypothetical protein